MSRPIWILASIGLSACIVLPPGGYDDDSETGDESEPADESDESELGCTSDIIRYCMDGDAIIHDKNGCFEDMTEDCVSECDDGYCTCLLTSSCSEDGSGVSMSCTAVVGQEPQEQMIECPFGCESTGDQAACKSAEDCITTTCVDEVTLLIEDGCGNGDPLPVTCENACIDDACAPCEGGEITIGCAFGQLWSFDGCGQLTMQACIHGCNPDTLSCNP